MKPIIFFFFLIISLGATAQEVDSRSIPDLKPIKGVATYEQFFAVHNCLTKGVRADTSIYNEKTHTWTLDFKKHNVTVLKMRDSAYLKYSARVIEVERQKNNIVKSTKDSGNQKMNTEAVVMMMWMIMNQNSKPKPSVQDQNAKQEAERRAQNILKAMQNVPNSSRSRNPGVGN